MSFAAALVAARAVARRVEANQLAHVSWSPPQAEFRAKTSRRRLLRAGNQIGKTWAGLSVVIDACVGSMPGGRQPPIEAWVVCTSWAQSVAIMRKFWELCPRSLLNGASFDYRRGFGKDNPAVVFHNGSIVRFRTTNQGPEALAGATVDLVLIDEPTTEGVYRELDRRVQRRAGFLLLTLTPINQPCEYLRELVEAGVIDEVHATLTPANLQSGGRPFRLLDGTPMDATWIADQRKQTPTRYAGIVLDGDWETRFEGAFFDVFDPTIHHSATANLTGGAPRWTLGIDYATADRDNGLCAVLSRHTLIGGKPWIIAEDEVTLPGRSSTEDFAAHVVAMLARSGLSWPDLWRVYADHPVRGVASARTSADLTREIAALVGVSASALMPRVFSAKEGRVSDSSLDLTCRAIYGWFSDRRVIVRPRCQVLSLALTKWDYSASHPLKDVIDAWRYSLRDLTHTRNGRTVGVRFR